jgi:hypothetical protein
MDVGWEVLGTHKLQDMAYVCMIFAGILSYVFI